MPIKIDDFCQVFIVKSKVLSLFIFILLGIALEIVVHLYLKIPYAYTHLFYLIIILAAIWYKRSAVYLALFFGMLHIVVFYFNEGFLSFEPILRALMLCVIAFIVGSVVECMTHFRDELAIQNKDLETTKEAFKTANKKLNLLSQITRHDILNHLTALLGYLEISGDMTEDPALLNIIKKEQHAANDIQRKAEFTQNYQDIGLKEPVWHNLHTQFHEIQNVFHHDTICLQSSMESVEILADPLFPLICQNLVDNSLRHGENMSLITLSTRKEGDTLKVIYEDDGGGIPDDEKEKIFRRGYGKNTGMGLFLSQEILEITGLFMQETGTYGSGVRFEIVVPPGAFRYIRQL